MIPEEVFDNGPLYPAALAPPGAEVPLWRVDVPDLPGCYVTGDTLAEVVDSAAGAVETWLAQVSVGGLPVPPPSTIDAWARSPDYPGCFWFFVPRAERVAVAGNAVLSGAATAEAEAPEELPEGLRTKRPDEPAPSID